MSPYRDPSAAGRRARANGATARSRRGRATALHSRSACGQVVVRLSAGSLCKDQPQADHPGVLWGAQAARVVAQVLTQASGSVLLEAWAGDQAADGQANSRQEIAERVAEARNSSCSLAGPACRQPPVGQPLIAEAGSLMHGCQPPVNTVGPCQGLLCWGDAAVLLLCERVTPDTLVLGSICRQPAVEESRMKKRRRASGPGGRASSKAARRAGKAALHYGFSAVPASRQ